MSHIRANLVKWDGLLTFRDGAYKLNMIGKITEHYENSGFYAPEGTLKIKSTFTVCLCDADKLSCLGNSVRFYCKNEQMINTRHLKE